MNSGNLSLDFLLGSTDILPPYMGSSTGTFAAPPAPIAQSAGSSSHSAGTKDYFKSKSGVTIRL
jgi:hypothetical protein